MIHSYVPFYHEILIANRPKLVFEWGPGPNTDLALKYGASVTTVEQNLKWMPKPKPNLTCLHISTKDPSYTNPVSFKDFDVFFVDSRRRAECIINAFKECKDTAIVCLHDAERSWYRKAINLFPYKKFYKNKPGSKWIRSGDGHDGSRTLFCVMSKSKMRLNTKQFI